MRRRILVVQPALVPYGGGEGVSAWILEALKDEHDVALLAWEAPDFGAVNRFYGTTLDASEIDVQVALPFLPRRLRRARVLRRLKYALLLAAARRRTDVDLLISAEEESDLGGRGIQYIHYPRLPDLRVPALRLRAYHGAIALVTGTRVARMRGNVTVANSDWTGARIRERHGLDSTTIHPPAAGGFRDVPWSRRADGFVCIGRFARPKRFELILAILGALRARGRDLRLHIVGSPANAKYEAAIVELARASSAWVTIERDLTRAELTELLSTNRYGIHAMAEEHFGMAVAEMVSAGMIVFVPRSGGQVETVTDDRLLWTGTDDAVAKIDAVLGSSELQEALGRGLAERRQHLSPARFMSEVRELVRRTVPSV